MFAYRLVLLDVNSQNVQSVSQLGSVLVNPGCTSPGPGLAKNWIFFPTESQTRPPITPGHQDRDGQCGHGGGRSGGEKGAS
jgi:hypothetical protein